MPLECITIEDKKYGIVMPDKAHEPEYRQRLTAQIIAKYGMEVTQEQTIPALTDCFNFYAEEFEKVIRQISDVNFFIYIYLLHEETAEVSYLTQEWPEFPINRSYFNLYRRILKLTLQEACRLSTVSSPAPDNKWRKEAIWTIEKLIYLGDFLYMIADAISEQKITGGSITISFEDDLLTFKNTPGWEGFLPAMLHGFGDEGRGSLIEEGLENRFNECLKLKIGIDLADIRSIIGTLNHRLHNMNPPRFLMTRELLEVLRNETESEGAIPFINGLILNRHNVASIKNAVEKPYLGKRVIHKPLLTLTLDGDECILVFPYSFEEAMNTFFQNNVTLGKFPDEWKALSFMEALVKEFKIMHKDMLEDPVEDLLKEQKISYHRNVKVLYAQNHQHLSINLKPGEIDFIFVLGEKIYIADCKNLTKRYEMHGWYQDISKFIKNGYNDKMAEKLAFLDSRPSLLEEHLRIALKMPDLNINDYTLEGIFIINTPTIYQLNGQYKIYTFHRFRQLLEGNDFFEKYFSWPRHKPLVRIRWPFIDNLNAALAGNPGY